MNKAKEVLLGIHTREAKTRQVKKNAHKNATAQNVSKHQEGAKWHPVLTVAKTKKSDET